MPSVGQGSWLASSSRCRSGRIAAGPPSPLPAALVGARLRAIPVPSPVPSGWASAKCIARKRAPTSASRPDGAVAKFVTSQRISNRHVAAGSPAPLPTAARPPRHRQPSGRSSLAGDACAVACAVWLGEREGHRPRAGSYRRVMAGRGGYKVCDLAAGTGTARRCGITRTIANPLVGARWRAMPLSPPVPAGWASAKCIARERAPTGASRPGA